MFLMVTEALNNEMGVHYSRIIKCNESMACSVGVLTFFLCSIYKGESGKREQMFEAVRAPKAATTASEIPNSLMDWRNQIESFGKFLNENLT